MNKAQMNNTKFGWVWYGTLGGNRVRSNFFKYIYF